MIKTEKTVIYNTFFANGYFKDKSKKQIIDYLSNMFISSSLYEDPLSITFNRKRAPMFKFIINTLNLIAVFDTSTYNKPPPYTEVYTYFKDNVDNFYLLHNIHCFILTEVANIKCHYCNDQFSDVESFLVHMDSEMEKGNVK